MSFDLMHNSTRPAPSHFTVAAVAEELQGVLTDTYRLIVRSQLCHWNVSGPLFHAVHELTEAQYENMFLAVDELAERIRAIGQSAVIDPADLAGRPEEGWPQAGQSATELVEGLASDHRRLAARLRALCEIAECAGDPVTADLATGRGAFHEKSSWMLGALVA